MSASLWGCELKCKLTWFWCIRRWSASLWGCELKYCFIRIFKRITSQPPCEAVSWNKEPISEVYKIEVSLLVRLWVEIVVRRIILFGAIVSLLVRLWVEIWPVGVWRFWWNRQPPCEAVSWNDASCIPGCKRYSQPPCEAVSWNSLYFSRLPSREIVN